MSVAGSRQHVHHSTRSNTNMLQHAQGMQHGIFSSWYSSIEYRIGSSISSFWSRFLCPIVKPCCDRSILESKWISDDRIVNWNSQFLCQNGALRVFWIGIITAKLQNFRNSEVFGCNLQAPFSLNTPSYLKPNRSLESPILSTKMWIISERFACFNAVLLAFFVIEIPLLAFFVIETFNRRWCSQKG